MPEAARTQAQSEPPMRELALGLSYPQSLERAGAMPVILPPLLPEVIDLLVARLDGLLLTGGPDLHPGTYGKTPHPALGPTEREIDVFELAVIRAAERRGLPVLAICRGMQALNVARGGTLHQHLPDRTDVEHLQRHEGFAPAHDVEVARGSLLHWLTDADRLAVNSFHHQAADRIGAGLEVAARAPDGTVEALWDPAATFCLGVQWHAELLTHRAEHATLLRGLVDAACGLPAQLTLAA
jgi:putative glutamine amidotransferase